MYASRGRYSRWDSIGFSEPNQEFQGLVCEGANVLPSKFLEDAFRDGYVLQEKWLILGDWMT